MEVRFFIVALPKHFPSLVIHRRVITAFLPHNSSSRRHAHVWKWTRKFLLDRYLRIVVVDYRNVVVRTVRMVRSVVVWLVLIWVGADQTLTLRPIDSLQVVRLNNVWSLLHLVRFKAHVFRLVLALISSFSDRMHIVVEINGTFVFHIRSCGPR